MIPEDAAIAGEVIVTFTKSVNESDAYAIVREAGYGVKIFIPMLGSALVKTPEGEEEEACRALQKLSGIASAGRRFRDAPE